MSKLTTSTLLSRTMATSAMASVASLKSIIPNSDLSEILYQKLFADSHGIVNKLPDGSFVSNQSYADNHKLYGPANCRIGAPQKHQHSAGWLAKANGDFITIDLLQSYLITGIATQARGGCAQWVTEYSIQTSENGKQWMDHGLFTGNFEQNEIVKNKLPKPACGRFVRLKISKFNSHPSIRLDILVNDMK